MIIRTIHNKESPYTMINNQSLWDDRLSLNAVAIWARLISRPDNWKISAIELSKSCKCSIKKIYSILQELISLGYCAVFQERRNGRFGKYEYFIFETAKTKEEVDEILNDLSLGSFVLSGEKLSQDSVSVAGHATNNYLTKDLMTKEEMHQKEKKYIKKSPENSNTTRQSNPPPLPEGECVYVTFDAYVKLKRDVYESLCKLYGDTVINSVIEEINDYLSATGKKPYKDYGAAIRNWLRRKTFPSQAKHYVTPPRPGAPPLSHEEMLERMEKKRISEEMIRKIRGEES